MALSILCKLAGGLTHSWCESGRGRPRTASSSELAVHGSVVSPGTGRTEVRAYVRTQCRCARARRCTHSSELGGCPCRPAARALHCRSPASLPGIIPRGNSRCHCSLGRLGGPPGRGWLVLPTSVNLVALRCVRFCTLFLHLRTRPDCGSQRASAGLLTLNSGTDFCGQACGRCNRANAAQCGARRRGGGVPRCVLGGVDRSRAVRHQTGGLACGRLQRTHRWQAALELD